MADNIVHLPDPNDRRLIWVCLCGCTVHRLYADGVVECADCDAPGRGSPDSWRVRLADEPADPKAIDEDCFKVVTLDTAATFYRRRLREDADQAVAIIAIGKDGGLATFLAREVQSKTWLRAKVRESMKRFTGQLEKWANA